MASATGGTCEAETRRSERCEHRATWAFWRPRLSRLERLCTRHANEIATEAARRRRPKTWQRIAQRTEGRRAMTETTSPGGVRIVRGQHWRQGDGYLVRVVGFFANGWPAVRHVNAKNGSHAVNPAWFDHWEMTREAVVV